MSQGEDCSHSRLWSSYPTLNMALEALLPLSRRADPGGAECMMMLSRARMVLVLPVPGGPCNRQQG